MNNYGRNQMNNRTRQGNMQYNRMNRDNCGCNTPRTTDNCGCNDNVRPVDNCGCDNHDHHDHLHHHESGTEGCNASRYDQLSGMALAMSYVPWQTFCQMYDLEEALCQGTIFKELDLDFMRGCRS